MLPGRLIVGGCLCVLMAPLAGAVAKPWVRAEPPPAEPPSLESSSASRSPPVSFVSRTIRVAQNASGRNNAITEIPNPASLSLQMSPDRSVSVGTKISFRITAKKPGYLLLVDIDAGGKISQIFPSPEMIVQSQEAAKNFVKPGTELLIPNSEAKKRGFEYVITAPQGEAAVVAILSERRVQILDLPDSAPKQRTEAEIISYLAEWTSKLRVADPDTGKLQPSSWSFDIRKYSIQ
jgi:hypothetical protein